MSEEKYKSYNRIHKYSNPSDIEKSKIKKETARYNKFNKKIKKLSNQIIYNYEESDESLFETYQEYINAAEQEKRTAKGHKKRLKELKKRDDFN
ncbi:hypothetical protein [Vallitalea okinawensis]|uniref:hypothetical protein n=1 Tax=Vallitalea okinawensis TaxID=2078660 RepID=UPI000CFC3D8D|nr:hypothetical protein [Vallitalea okinawensis]